MTALGIDPAVHDVRFEEDNWESPTLGAWGVGWQVLLDGMEITQFTYFQQAGGIDLKPIAAELTYGLERIAMFLQRKDSIYDIDLGRRRDVRRRCATRTRSSCRATPSRRGRRRDAARATSRTGSARPARCLEEEEPLVVPGLEATLKMSHLFNLLDARGAVAVTERVALIGRVRKLAVRCAKAYVEQRERLGFPLLGRPGGDA